MKQTYLGLRHELVVDNFAGGGGASTGIEAGIGRAIDIAINHDREAIAMHMANHPDTKHYCEDVFSIDPLEVTKGQPVGLAWFSPDCKHFSKAKGGKPVSKKIRGLAWVVIKWARTVKPRVIMLENVEEFETWGPLTADGMPCPKRKGLTFRRWRAQLINAGYKVEMKTLRACDYGAPTIRKRLFIIARCDRQPIVWPKPTHGPGLKPFRTAAECIDWSIPCPSIFERERPLKPATLRRIANGIRKFVINSADPFIVPVTHHGTDRGRSVGDPVSTVTGAHRGELAIVTPHITKFRANSTGSRCDEPLHTVTAGGDMKRPAGAAHAMGIVCPTLVQTGYGERNGQEPRSLDIEKPLGTVVSGQKHALASIFMAAASGPTYAQKPRTAKSPINSMTTDTRAGVVTAFLAKHFGGNETPGWPLDKPISTLTAVDHHAFVSAQLVGCGGRASQSPPRDASQPTATLTSKADACVVASHLVKLKGTCNDGQRVDEPIHTVQAGGNHFAEVRAFLLQYYSSGSNSRSINDPAATVTSKDRIGLVTIHGVDYAIVDIGMRMLQPHELFAAQGFPSKYIIAPTINGKRMTKTAQVRMCGNSVCPPIAEALVRANFRHELQYEAVA